MKRRAVLAVGLAALGGCLGEAGLSTGDPEENRTRTVDDSTDTPVPSDAEIVAYADLSEEGQQFVDDAQDRGHNLDWLSHDGNRTYVRYDRDRKQYVRVDDPLTLADVDDELEDVFRGDALVERDGRLYSGGKSVGHGQYKQRYEATEDPDCDDAVDATELSESSREILRHLQDRGTVWVSTRKFERVAAADVYVDDWELIGRFRESVGVPSEDGGCVEVNDRQLRVRFEDRAEMNHRGYHLEFVADAD